ncbi:MAG: SAM-dependent methyltransferase, partial [Sphaerobacter sp.]|nr:SAM-dependent methyltransferase [Sphaerobacter sp.]
MGEHGAAARGHWDESNRELVAIIRDRIAAEGRITFAAFMELALYHPAHGYYRSASPRAGRAGDFITAPEAHAIFGHTLARKLAALWRRLDRPDPFTLREYGAGAGTLALAILDGLRADGDELLAAIRYEPIEINAARRAELAERLTAAGFADRLHDPEPGQPITGCVLANEFIDAFPVHRVTVRDGVLHELYVVWRDGWFADELGPLSTPA